jgi:toxin YoeB
MNRQLSFKQKAWDDYLGWQMQDKKTLKRINQLLKEILRDPFNGIGKPEALKGELSGLWSRRIDDVNRLLYRVSDDVIEIIQCRTHYEDK